MTYKQYKTIIRAIDFKNATDIEIEDFIDRMADDDEITNSEYYSLYQSIVNNWRYYH